MYSHTFFILALIVCLANAYETIDRYHPDPDQGLNTTVGILIIEN